MAKRNLDLSQTLSPLKNELQELLTELLQLKQEDSPLFDAAIEDFISKYGCGPKYNSLDELLQSSAIQAGYVASAESSSLDDLLKDLMPN